VPKKFPPEFKRDVVTVARRGDLTVAEVAVDFDVSEESVRRWMKQADIDDGPVNGQTSSETEPPPALSRASDWIFRAASWLGASKGTAPTFVDSFR
jgi:transposase-like protein